MAKGKQDFNFSLLQRDSNKELMLSKMRDKLAGKPKIVEVIEMKRGIAFKQRVLSWGWRGVFAALLVAANVYLISEKDLILSKVTRQGVSTLPKPALTMSTDDQALYWTYALYDFNRLESKYGIQGNFAINAGDARKRLQDLLPYVSLQTLGTISRYSPVAFKTVSAGGEK